MRLGDNVRSRRCIDFVNPNYENLRGVLFGFHFFSLPQRTALSITATSTLRDGHGLYYQKEGMGAWTTDRIYSQHSIDPAYSLTHSINGSRLLLSKMLTRIIWIERYVTSCRGLYFFFITSC